MKDEVGPHFENEVGSSRYVEEVLVVKDVEEIPIFELSSIT